jgi:hypothetical protein
LRHRLKSLSARCQPRSGIAIWHIPRRDGSLIFEERR